MAQSAALVGRTLVVVVPLSLLVGCGGATQTGSGSACAAPVTTTDRATVSRGEKMVVEAEYLWDRCNDTGPDSGRPALPRTDVTVEWTQADSTILLATVDADATGAARVTVTVPPSAQVGVASVEIGEAGEPATVTVVE